MNFTKDQFQINLKMLGLCLIAVAPLFYLEGFGDSWNDIKILLFFVGLVFFIYAPETKTHSRQFHKWNHSLAILLLIVMSSILVPVALGDATLGARTFFSVVLIGLAGFSLIKTPCLNIREKMQLQTVMVVVMIISIFWVFLSHGGLRPHDMNSESWNIKWRAITSFGNPNRTAEFLGLALCFCPYLFLKNDLQEKKMRIFIMGLAISLVSAIVLCFSRSVLLSLIVTTSFFLLLKWEFKKFSYFMFFLVIIIFFVGFILYLNITPESPWLAPLINLKSISGRLSEYKFLIIYLIRNDFCIFGTGLEPKVLQDDLIRPVFYHSDIFGLWIEIGAIGFLCLLSFVTILLRKAQNFYLWIPFAFLFFQSLYQFPLRDPGVLSWIYLILLFTRGESAVNWDHLKMTSEKFDTIV